MLAVVPFKTGGNLRHQLWTQTYEYMLASCPVSQHKEFLLGPNTFSASPYAEHPPQSAKIRSPKWFAGKQTQWIFYSVHYHIRNVKKNMSYSIRCCSSVLDLLREWERDEKRDVNRAGVSAKTLKNAIRWLRKSTIFGNKLPATADVRDCKEHTNSLRK